MRLCQRLIVAEATLRLDTSVDNSSMYLARAIDTFLIGPMLFADTKLRIDDFADNGSSGLTHRRNTAGNGGGLLENIIPQYEAGSRDCEAHELQH
jgi:hypothetical protein